MNKKTALTFATFSFGASVFLKNGFAVVRCDSSRALDVTRSLQKKDIKFDWKLFWSYLSKHIVKLLGAIAAALAVAYLNISIPSLLGALINTLSKYAGDAVVDAKNFIQVGKKFAHKNLISKKKNHFRT